MIHIITDESCTVILKGIPYIVAFDQPTYVPLVRAIRENDERRVEQIATTHKRVVALIDYFGDCSITDGQIVRGGPQNILVDQVLDNLNGDFLPHLEEAERVLRL